MGTTTITPTLARIGMAPPLPPAPNIDEVRRQVTERLQAIERDALRVLARERILLERTWRSGAWDAVPLHTSDGDVIPTHPAGVERLSSVLAAQESLRLEMVALRELAAALELYDAGGSASCRLVSETWDESSDASEEKRSRGVEGASAGMVQESAFTRWLLEYLLTVQRELWIARKEGDAMHRELLQSELAELEALIQRRAAAIRSVPEAPKSAPRSRSA